MTARGERLAATFLFLAALALGASVAAHEFSQSESTIELDGRDVRVRLSLNLVELAEVDTSRDGRVSYDELDTAIERVVALVRSHFTVRAPDPPARVAVDRYEIIDDHVLQMEMRYQFGHEVRQVDVASTFDALLGPMHQHFATARFNGELRRVVLAGANRSAHFDASRMTRGRVLTVVLALLGIALLGVYRKRAWQKP